MRVKSVTMLCVKIVGEDGFGKGESSVL